MQGNEKEKPKRNWQVLSRCSKPIVERKKKNWRYILCTGYPECKTIITNLETMEYWTPEENKNKKETVKRNEKEMMLISQYGN